MTPAAQSIRNLAMAVGIGALAALLVDAALQNALAAVRSPGLSATTPWWMIGRVMERAPWLAAALFVWAAARPLARAAAAAWPADYVVHRAAALAVVGGALIAAPLLWLAATWLVWAVKITLVGSWGSEGRIFLEGYFYSNVLMAYTPWAAGGAVLLTASRHVPLP